MRTNKMSKVNNVCILGGAGYVGNALWHHLTEQGYAVTSYDLELFGKPENQHNMKMDIRDLTESDLAHADVVVLLAGHSSVQMCQHNYHSAWANNVTNFMKLTALLNDTQKLIYASSSSVYGHWPHKYATEQGGLGNPVNPYDHTKQTIDAITETMYQHQIRTGAPVADPTTLQCSNIYGLRFGTVNGYSQNLRTDVMINAMWHSAKKNKEVRVSNGDTRRSILGINDLCRAVHSIIEGKSKRGIYNLASFHSTSLEIGKTVANVLNVPCVEVETKPVSGNAKMTTKNYDFWVDTTKFEMDYDFEFKDSIASIVQELELGIAENKLKGLNTIQKPRSKTIQYNRT